MPHGNTPKNRAQGRVSRPDMPQTGRKHPYCPAAEKRAYEDGTDAPENPDQT